VKELYHSVDSLLVLSIWDVEKAFLIPKGDQMIGKIAKESVIPVSGPYSAIVNHFHTDIRQTSIQSKAGFLSDVIAGGTGGLSCTIAEWMV
jgi:hypothetical protein